MPRASATLAAPRSARSTNCGTWRSSASRYWTGAAWGLAARTRCTTARAWATLALRNSASLWLGTKALARRRSSGSGTPGAWTLAIWTSRSCSREARPPNWASARVCAAALAWARRVKRVRVLASSVPLAPAFWTVLDSFSTRWISAASWAFTLRRSSLMAFRPLREPESSFLTLKPLALSSWLTCAPTETLALAAAVLPRSRRPWSGFTMLEASTLSGAAGIGSIPSSWALIAAAGLPWARRSWSLSLRRRFLASTIFLPSVWLRAFTAGSSELPMRERRSAMTWSTWPICS